MAGIIRRDIPLSASPLSLRDVATEGEAILAQAREQAQRIVTESRARAAGKIRAELEQARQRGLEEGRKAGMEQMHREARERVLADTRGVIENTLKSLQIALADFDRAKHALLADAQTGMVRLAWEIARRVCKTLGERDAQVAGANVAAVVAMARNESDLRIELHPADLAELQALSADGLAAIRGLDHSQLSPADDLARGGCRLTSRRGVIDAGLPAQLDAIAEAICIPQSRESHGARDHANPTP